MNLFWPDPPTKEDYFLQMLKLRILYNTVLYEISNFSILNTKLLGKPKK